MGSEVRDSGNTMSLGGSGLEYRLDSATNLLCAFDNSLYFFTLEFTVLKRTTIKSTLHTSCY